jgi:hypothetical protein
MRQVAVRRFAAPAAPSATAAATAATATAAATPLRHAALPAAVRAVHYARSLGLLSPPAHPASTPLTALTASLPKVVIRWGARLQPVRSLAS